MSWDVEPTNDTDINAYQFFRQFWAASRERYLAVNASQRFWPRHNIIHSSGTISTITSGSMTAVAGHYNARAVGADGKWPADTWYNYTDGVNNAIPQFYDLVVDFNDFTTEHKVVRSEIQTHPSGNTIFINNITDYVTAGWISSISELNGKPFYIIRRDGLWSTLDRWPAFPNDQELEKGTSTSSNHQLLSDSTKDWTTNQWSGKDLMVSANNGLLYRLNVSGNTSNTLAFASGDRIPSGRYAIVKLGDKCTPTKDSGMPFWWYGGNSSFDENTHYPDDTINPTRVVDNTINYDSGELCKPSYITDTFDIDVWKEYGDLCDDFSSDFCFSPNLFKTARQLQVFLEEISLSFIEEKEYSGESAMPNFVEATFFKKADINWQEDTYTPTNNGVVNYNFTAPYSPIYTYWGILDNLGNVIDHGQENTSSGILTKTIDGNTYSGVLTTGVVSFGWTRYYPKEFRYMYDSECFIHDLYGGPNEDYPGNWIERSKSSTYKEHDDYGNVIEGGSGFVTNDLVRYTGDNWNDPTLQGISDAQQLEDYDGFFEGWRSPSNQDLIDASMIGIASSGSNRQLIDSSQNWYSIYPMGGVLRTETGTSTGGSTTSLVDSSKSANPFWDGTTGRWTNFILDILGSGVGAGEKFPITSSNTTTLNFSSYNAISIPNNTPYQIREPDNILNRWQGRTLRINKLDQTSQDVVIKYSDDNSLFFDPIGFPVESGMVYRILEDRPGKVWKSSGSGWIVPTGIDSRSGKAFRSDQVGSLPHVVKKYGRAMKGDYVNYYLFRELYKGLNALVWTKTSFSWTNASDGVSGEPNTWTYSRTGGGGEFLTEEIPHYYWDYGTSGTVYWTEKRWNELGYAGPTDGSINSLAPHCYYGGSATPALIYDPDTDTESSGHIYTSNADQAWAYGSISSNTISKSLAHSLDWYVFAGINSSNNNQSTGGDNNSYDFDNNGDDNGGAFQYRKWTKYDSSGPSFDTDYVSEICGGETFTLPNVCDEPADLDVATSSLRGYYILDKTAIIKWDVANGFKFYD